VSHEIIEYTQHIKKRVEICDICKKEIRHDYYYPDTVRCDLCGADLCEDCIICADYLGEYIKICENCEKDNEESIKELFKLSDEYKKRMKKIVDKIFNDAVKKYNLK